MSKLLELIDDLTKAFIFFMIGFGIGIAQWLGSAQKAPARVVLGRAISTGGLAMGAGVGLVFMPEMSFLAQIGLAASLACLGVAGLERLFQSFISKGK